MAIIKKYFGKTKDNKEVNSFIFNNKNGISMEVITYGGAITSLCVPDRNGKIDDIVLGYDNITSYEKGGKFFGAIVGRCANRIKNGSFKINGKEYLLARNDGLNHIHGGIKGFDKVIWDAEIVSNEENILKLSYLSKDGEEGYPGNLFVTVYYSLTYDNCLKIEYNAVSDKDTIVNLTNHSYFNLGGHSSGDILNHKLMINSKEFTVNDRYSIPNGEIRNVSDTPMDFRTMKRLGEDIESSYEQIKFGKGYDHNWMLESNNDLKNLSAKLIDEYSGRSMEMYTTNEGVQIYSANFLDGSDIGKDNTSYGLRNGICLETQYVPNAINNSKFKSPLLKAKEEYKNTTIYKFSII